MEEVDENNFILSLIKNVEERKCLYDKSDAFYYNRNVKEKAWKEVAEICNKSSADCKHRWKLLRERFCKTMKKIETPTSSSMSHLEKWKYMRPMMFLKCSVTVRRTRDNVVELKTESVSERSIFSVDDSSQPAPSTPPKTTYNNHDSPCQKVGEAFENINMSLVPTPEQNAVDNAFTNTVLCLMKDLPVAVKDEFQAGMLQELYRLRRENRDAHN